MKNDFAWSIVSCVQLQFDHIQEQNIVAGFAGVLLLYQVVAAVVKLVVVVVKIVVVVVEVVKIVDVVEI